MGKKITMISFSTSSLRRSAIDEAKYEKPNDATAAISATDQSSALLRENFIVAKVVPAAAENLFVAHAFNVGSPIKKYAGSEINPPPPAMESTKPAKKQRYKQCSMCMLLSYKNFSSMSAIPRVVKPTSSSSKIFFSFLKIYESPPVAIHTHFSPRSCCIRASIVVTKPL